MGNRKLTLTSKAIDLTIHYNKTVVGSLVTIFAGCLLILLFAKSGNIKLICGLGLCLDILVFGLTFFSNCEVKIEDSDSDTRPEANKPKKSGDAVATVEHSSSSSGGDDSKDEEVEIKNKVPSPGGGVRIAGDTPPEAPAPPEGGTEPEVAPPSDDALGSVESMSDADWESLFSMDD